MKYRVTIEGREREVDVTLTPDGRASVVLDGAPIDADVERVPGGVSLRIGGRVFDVALGGKNDELQVAAGASRSIVQAQSERARAKGNKRGLGTGGKEMRAPMPGRVVKVLVSTGADVSEGQACVVIEAMKMENELRATIAGKVASVHIAEGASVEGRALLITFE
jgi:biotin carboxyl carrier protein